MKNDVIELAKNLDKLDFNQLIQTNQLKQEHKNIIRNYIDYLSNKDS